MLENIEFNIIINNLKYELKIDTDKELSERLGLNRGSFSERKVRQSLPYKQIIELCLTQNISLDKIFTNNLSIDYKNKEILIIDLDKYSDEKDIIEIIELLKCVSKNTLTKLKNKLFKIKNMTEDIF